MWTKKFWKDAAERAIKTFAEVFVSFIVVGTTGVLEFDWATVGSISAMAGLASVLMSLASKRVGNSESASIVKDR